MFALLDIAIGLIFTYLILSLLASEIQEQIAALLEFRALHLKRAIKVLLGEDTLGTNSTVSRWVTRDANKTPVLIPNDKVSEFASGDPQQVWLDNHNRVLATRDTEVQTTPNTNTGKLLANGTEVRKAEIELQSIRPQLLTDLLYHNSEIRDLNQYATGFFTRTLLRFRTRTPSTESKQKTSEGPSYISPETFAISLLEVIQEQLPSGHQLNVTTETLDSFLGKLNMLPVGETAKQRLIQVIQRLEFQARRATLTGTNNQTSANPPLQEIRNELQRWYEKSIAPSSGVYKRNAKGLSLLIGLIMAVLLNINIFNIIDSLQNQDIRAALIRNAEEATQNQAITEKCTANNNSKECVNRLNLLYKPIEEISPSLKIGWQLCSKSPNDLQDKCKDIPDIPEQIYTESQKGIPIVGWIISAIAISMGAPFWFDILSQVMNVRNANKPKQSTTQNQVTTQSNNS